jgi:MFS family permease
MFMALSLVAAAILAGGLPPVFAAIHAVCGNRRRAMAIALVLFSATLFGSGLGPLATGVLSDLFSSTYGAEGLRYSLIIIMAVLAASAIAFYICGRAMPRDLEQ